MGSDAQEESNKKPVQLASQGLSENEQKGLAQYPLFAMDGYCRATLLVAINQLVKSEGGGGNKLN